MKRLVAIVAFFAVGLGGGIAYSYITSPGAGTGIALTSSATPVTISATATAPTTALIPGGVGDVTFKVANPNATPVTIASVVGNGTLTVTGGSGCTALNSGVSFTDQTGLSISVPANATEFTIDLPGSVAMSNSSDNGCQGATFLIPILVTVHQG